MTGLLLLRLDGEHLLLTVCNTPDVVCTLFDVWDPFIEKTDQTIGSAQNEDCHTKREVLQHEL